MLIQPHQHNVEAKVAIDDSLFAPFGLRMHSLYMAIVNLRYSSGSN